MVHKALGAVRVERVDHLLHPEHVQRGHAEDLGLAALEQRGPVHPGQHVGHRGQRPDVGQAAAVDAEPFGDDPLSDELLGQRELNWLRSPSRASSNRSANCSRGERLDPVGLGLPVLLVGDRQRLRQ